MLQIIEVAVELIARDGYAALDFADLAKKCKITRPLIHHYFAKKEQLFSSLVQYVGIEHQKYIIAALSKNEKSGRSLLRAYLRSNMTWPKERRSHSRVWMHYLALSASQNEARRENTLSVDHGAQRIWEILQIGARNNEWASEKLLEKARTLQIVLSGAVISLITEERTDEEAQFLLQIVLGQAELILGTKIE
ncbi:TetR/AcrR family transcriptional regulator [Bdellovibrio svalbardensis]|uniref:TetR/AcrR family transcriptional regulator n=1 Tax=Bdellovibrio svalbardensis TaxID=2972972 RepID=UPI00240821FE|nr:TetR/AcrR family transcriptional regulator [Bdellovibrio svalbardensis]